jgi:CheY-like chemotaxis protein
MLALVQGQRFNCKVIRMMIAQERTGLRAVILPADRNPTGESITGRLLTDLGHSPMPAASPAHALSLLREEPTDLLIVDVTNSSENSSFVQKLVDLPLADRPRQISVFSDVMSDSLRTLSKQFDPAHVHILLKPLHVHGLLQVLRQIDAEDEEVFHHA